MGGKRPAMPGSGSGSGRAQLYRPTRVEVVERFEEERLLPAIYFVFSRAGCDESVRRCLDDGLRLTTPEERLRIRGIVESYVDPLTDEDLSVLGYPSYVAGLEAGVAAHHAGMVPPFREAVEASSQRRSSRSSSPPRRWRSVSTCPHGRSSSRR